MTVVVSDNSPLSLLACVGLVDLLPQLFARVLVPPAVVAEMAHPKAPPEVRAFAAALPTWLAVQVPITSLELPQLDPESLRRSAWKNLSPNTSPVSRGLTSSCSESRTVGRTALLARRVSEG